MLVWGGLLFFIALIFYQSRRKSRFPPGPPKFPVVGTLLSVLWADAKYPHLAFTKLSKMYGPLLGLQMGSVQTVVINGHEMLNRVANSGELTSRIDGSEAWLLEKSRSIPSGLVFSLHEVWSHVRPFCAKEFRKYGLSDRANPMSLWSQEIVGIRDWIKGQMSNGQVTLTFRDEFRHMNFNIIWTFLTGNKYGTEDTKQNLFQLTDDYIRLGKFSGSVVQIYPGLLKIFPGLTGFSALQQSCAMWRDSIAAILHEAREDGGYKTAPCNFVEDYLHAIEDNLQPKDSLQNMFTEDNLVATIQDVLLTAMDTQSTGMKLFVRFLIDYPNVQDKVREEVDRVVGKSRMVSSYDVPKLKYLQAALNELIRHSSIAPIVPRKLLNDWVIDDYLIPKGTLVIMNIWSGDHDEKIYKNPSDFDPTRFLNENGSLIDTEKLFAFGFGKRRCMAELFVKNWLTLIAATFVQNFSFHVDPAFGTSWGRSSLGLTLFPPPYSVLVKLRDQQDS